MAPALSSLTPDVYRAIVETTTGNFDIEIHRSWSPHCADRFYELACCRYYDDSRFFRVVAGKWAQFGIAGEPAAAQARRNKTIPDDVPVQANRIGFVAFANTGPGTRSTQVYINLRDNSVLNDAEPAFAPFGVVVSGTDAVEKLYAGYGETSGGGVRAGNQDALFAGGNRYLDRRFPKLDRLIRLVVVGS
jgi:peptidyl-prolyl cis-trans isomerase A (cyclophilin A)